MEHRRCDAISHTYTQNVVHLVFSTKERTSSIPREFQPDLWAYVAGICKHQGIVAHAVGGAQDHIHLLLQIPPVLAMSKAVLTIKSNSSKWARENGHALAWQQGYAAFSVSASVMPTVVQYIRNQEAHHKKMSFAEEFVVLLKKHNVDYDPRFVLG